MPQPGQILPAFWWPVRMDIPSQYGPAHGEQSPFFDPVLARSFPLPGTSGHSLCRRSLRVRLSPSCRS